MSYGAVTKVNDQEFERMVVRLEELDFAKQKLTPGEKALREILAALIEVYDDEHHPLPERPPHEMVKHLMEQRGLKQADLVPVLGSRAQLSDLVNGNAASARPRSKRSQNALGCRLSCLCSETRG